MNRSDSRPNPAPSPTGTLEAPPAPLEKLHDVHSVAQILGCSKRTVWSLAQDGSLPRVRLSAKVVRFRESDVRRLIEARLVS